MLRKLGLGKSFLPVGRQGFLFHPLLYIANKVSIANKEMQCLFSFTLKPVDKIYPI